MSFDIISEFEKQIADFFGAPYAIATDCCTHGVELCLRHQKVDLFYVPKHTYISIPFLAHKLGINFEWKDEKWQDYYYLTDNIIDAAVLWKRNSYINGTFMCLSFQFRKHISTFGYHYYMTPETAKIGLEKLPKAISTSPKKWTISDWPDLTKMEVFK